MCTRLCVGADKIDVCSCKSDCHRVLTSADDVVEFPRVGPIMIISEILHELSNKSEHLDSGVVSSLCCLLLINFR